MKKFVVMLFLSLPFLASAGTARSDRSDFGAEILAQYARMKSVASKLKPEFDVGGYLNGKTYGDHELLWHLAEEPGEAEVIRIFREKPDGQAFDITFHRNNAIVPGRTVIRRFVGPVKSGWRNDTVDANTGEYLGSQGQTEPEMDKRDQEIMRRWLK